MPSSMRMWKLAAAVGLGLMSVAAFAEEKCIDCHAIGEKPHHMGATSDCMTCHLSHQDVDKMAVGMRPANYLRVREPISCLECHSVTEQYYRHEIAVADCTTCHYGHEEAGELPEGVEKLRFNLRRRAPDLCLDCHRIDLKKNHMISTHPTYKEIDPEFETGDPQDRRPFNCLTCHNPHGAAQPRLFRYDYSGSRYPNKYCSVCHSGVEYGPAGKVARPDIGYNVADISAPPTLEDEPLPAPGKKKPWWKRFWKKFIVIERRPQQR